MLHADLLMLSDPELERAATAGATAADRTTAQRELSRRATVAYAHRLRMWGQFALKRKSYPWETA